LAITYAPVWLFLVNQTRANQGASHSGLQALFLSLYNLYAVLLSESVAPWFLPLALPAIFAMTAAGVVLVAYAHGFPRRLLIYFVVLLVGMAIANVISTKRVLMLTPWLLLGVALAASDIANRRARATLLVSLGLIAAAGWIGITARKYYVAPHFIEPWRAVAQRSVPVWRSGGTVLSNSGPFLFYFAYAAGTPWTTANWSPGAQMTAPLVPRVVDPIRWRERGTPVTERVLLVKGVDPQAIDWAAQQLDRRCSLQSVELEVKDSGYALKQRLFPEGEQMPWRVEVRQYRCGGNAKN
jgi:hypothetical protein